MWVRKQIGSHIVDFVPIPRRPGPGDFLPWLLSIEGIVRGRDLTMELMGRGLAGKALCAGELCLNCARAKLTPAYSSQLKPK